ncbi:helix-turn-helix domain-containing protein [Paenibacillus sp. LMG 31456]|uniref:Helix-turn-helix domain-containing protein n=1 Tax=Paenibacillus foliorum TaxID=2654974 RepID=A0A972GSW9_9BACL|nr:helix-turn-helix domain-containing protein [Paenibacillus foliorum]
MNDIGGNIKRLRKLHMLNQIEFAKRIGISQGSLSDIESGKCSPSIETVVSIYRSFNCSLEILLLGEEKFRDRTISELESKLLCVFNELDH